MIGIAHDGVIEVLQCKSSIEQGEALSIIKSGAFDFLILFPESRMHAMAREVDPGKLRFIYATECGPIPYTSGIITILSWTSFQNVEALAGQDRHVYYSRLGFLRSPTDWLNRDNESKLSAKYEKLASFVPERRVLFYGTQTVQMQNLFEERGLKIIHVGFIPSSRKQLIDSMIEFGCFAMAGRDGMSLQCWRDAEASLSAVPYLRATVNHKLADLFDPFGGPVYVGDEDNMDEVILRISDELEDGTALSLAKRSRAAARMVSASMMYWRCREALACDHEFLKSNIAAPATTFIEKAKGSGGEARDPLVMNSALSCLRPKVNELGGFVKEEPNPFIREIGVDMDGPSKVVSLANGQKVFENRSYEFTDVGEFAGWSFARTGNKTCMSLSVSAPSGSTVWIAVDSRMESVVKDLGRFGWSLAGKLRVTDPGLVFMAVFRKSFATSTSVIVRGGAMANASFLSRDPFVVSRSVIQGGTRGVMGHWPKDSSTIPVVKNIAYDTSPIIIHRNGGGGGSYGKSFFDRMSRGLPGKGQSSAPFSNGLTIATWAPSSDRNLMQRSLWRLGMDCLVMSPCRSVNEKIELTLVMPIRTKYVLLLDMFDVVVLGNPSRAVEEMRRRGCKALFAAEKNHFPDIPTKEFELSKSVPPFQFLNSGCIVAEWDYLRGVLDRERKMTESELALGGGDQRVYKMLYQKCFPDIQIDDRCVVFQCLYKVDRSEVIIIDP